METTITFFKLGPIIGPSGFVFALLTYCWILQQSSGQGRMIEIAKLIESGSMAFLKKEYSLLLIFLLIVTFLIGNFLGQDTAFCYLLGSITSMLCGFVGMKAATKANVRTAQAAAEKRVGKALVIAFFGGSVMGMTVVSLGLFGVILSYHWFFQGTVEALIGFAMGASSIALFSRVGGGIYTKAADISADIVGKIEVNIPEDDPRNPATIADNVGDNVGDIAGMGADIFESYVGSIIATMFIGTTYPLYHNGAIILPMIIGLVGLISSMLGILSIIFLGHLAPAKAMRITSIVGLLLFLIGSYLVIDSFQFTIFPFALGPFYAIFIGALAGLSIGLITEYFTSINFSPTKSIINASKTGSATNIISGLSSGMYSSVPPVLIICMAIYFSHYFSGLYGIGIAAVGMLATTGVIMTIDAYSSIVDNASGIAEMAGLGPEVRKITNRLNNFGNTNSGPGKGFSIGSAALTALAMYSAYSSAVGLETINILSSRVVIGLFVGGILPFFCGASTLGPVSKAAQKIVEEVRRQFQESPGIIEGRGAPDPDRCIGIATQVALKEMLLPGLVTILAPILMGFLLGKEALGGMLMGATLTGVLLALFMTNAGEAWNNAKVAIEQGYLDGEKKDSEIHHAAITGDIVGDPLKDTSGPTMNILIKLMSIVALLMAPLLK